MSRWFGRWAANRNGIAFGVVPLLVTRVLRRLPPATAQPSSSPGRA